MALPLWAKQAYWTLASLGLLYVLAILALTIPTIQRNAIYAHKVNPTIWQDLSNVDQFGFLQYQVQPFTVSTRDNETIFAWHITPLQIYQRHEETLKKQNYSSVEPYQIAASHGGLSLMLDDPNAIVVLSFHGNAAHLASAQRPATYRQWLGLSTPDRPVYVVAFDYRGFGLSSGTPTEDGIIMDALSLSSSLTGYVDEKATNVEYSLKQQGSGSLKSLKPSQIILAGQSLGTFASTALYHDWAIRLRRPPFRGLLLMASFTSLTKLLNSYSIKGITPPILSPLMGYPRVQSWFLSKLADKWDTERKLIDIVTDSPSSLNITLIHARDDWEIPWSEGRGNWNAIMNAAGAKDLSDQAIADGSQNIDLQTWQSVDKSINARWELILHGGHNRVAVSEQAKLAVWRMIQQD